MAKILKLSATGNSFLFADFRIVEVQQAFLKRWGKKKRSAIARELCNVYHSIGADGVVFLENSKIADVKWDFYNADGSPAEMCGNAARCVGWHELRNSLQSESLESVTLETRAGVVTIRRAGAYFDVAMPIPTQFKPKLSIKLSHKKLTFDFVNTGVPHAVVDVSNMKSLENMQKNVDKLAEIVNKIRALTQFKKGGTNVTFFAKKSPSTIDSLTFERGVEGYTQACGTGAVAAATMFARGKRTIVKLKVPGGRLLVNLKSDRPHLIGPAYGVAEIDLM